MRIINRPHTEKEVGFEPESDKKEKYIVLYYTPKFTQHTLVVRAKYLVRQFVSLQKQMRDFLSSGRKEHFIALSDHIGGEIPKEVHMGWVINVYQYLQSINEFPMPHLHINPLPDILCNVSISLHMSSISANTVIHVKVSAVSK